MFKTNWWWVDWPVLLIYYDLITFSMSDFHSTYSFAIKSYLSHLTWVNNFNVDIMLSLWDSNSKPADNK